MKDFINLAKSLKELRLSTGKSQAEFAKMLGISQTAWSAYERGDTRPKLALLIALEAHGYKIEGLTTGVLPDSIKGRTLGIDFNALNVPKEEAEWKMAYLAGFSPDMDIDELSKKVDEKYRREMALVASAKAGPKIPILRQKVSCGPGVEWETEDNIEDYLDIFSLFPQHKHSRLFAFPVQGTSMIGAGIRNGDYVLFNANADQYLTDGTYVFVLDGEVYCKRLEFDKLSKKIKIYSVRVAELEKAELLTSVNTEDDGLNDRFQIFGRVVSWVHPNNDDN